ncbi:MAG: hypothetical protein AAGB02_01475 [Pseudomonadota bacterium]
MNEQRSDTIIKNSQVDGFDWIKPPGEACEKFNFDAEKYLEHANDFEMTEEEKAELLSILWSIMCSFVELGFSLDSISLLELCANQDADEMKEIPANAESNE